MYSREIKLHNSEDWNPFSN